MVTSDQAPDPRATAPESTFSPARPAWLDSLGNVRNVVRQEMISRQLDRHLPAPGAWVLDVGAGQGTQSIRLARAGHRVHAVEPDADMRTAFDAALSGESTELQERVTLQEGRIGELAAVMGDRVYDVVLVLEC
jgi:S-adenosylmethionine-dependent methyltransferase